MRNFIKSVLASCLFLYIGITASSQSLNYYAPSSAGDASYGNYNTALGEGAGDILRGNYNSIFGFHAGKNSQSNAAINNSFIGARSGFSTTSGTDNTFSGYAAGYSNTTASGNTYVGSDAGYSTSTSGESTMLGYRTGFNTTAGSNTFIGFCAGYNNITGGGNVFLGKQAGFYETASNKLYIDNSTEVVPLIYGDFALNQVGINTNAAGYTLNVGGTFHTDGAVSIGTTNAYGYKLAVAGKAIAEEIVIKLQSAWPDYVFDKDYKMLTLSELQRYVRKHKHLPDVPSAATIAKNGVNVGEMNGVLLKKIEELTLYILELKSESEKQALLIEELRKK